MYTLALENRFSSIIRFFDELFGKDTDDEIEEAKEKIAHGDIAGGEAEMLSVTSKLIQEKADEDAQEDEEDTKEA